MDWTSYRTENDPQSDPQFDSMGCLSFSAVHCLEMQLNRLLVNLSADQINYLKNNGYINQEGKFEASERYIACVSGTTPSGNEASRVWQAIKTCGLVPLCDLPFDQSMTRDEFYAPVSYDLIQKGKEFLKRFKIDFDIVEWDITDPKQLEPQFVQYCLKDCPLQITIPIPSHHAVVLAGDTNNSYQIYDQYFPFEYSIKYTYPINSVTKSSVTPL